ncbi:Rho-type gtpase-activating protein [Entomophthora muscae]|uniref:Rho-type gtpase-activating protein n=1 Tax=Entomophthora muscae TaxID=34485 RepID=A0ACC2TF56_9FUNG|nr:Rho-type gtpase-activating protein [Entomophthora muscae]
MWHLACFNCVKCHNNIEPDSNLLLLSDGSPLCSECSQHCNVCNLPISDEAVMTADQCYHAKCFKCTKCNNKIEGSLFARTSSGIYCMSCYAERREAQKKKGQGSNAPKPNTTKEKSLPSLPVEALFELGSEEKDRPNSAGLDAANFKANSTPAISHSHSLSSKSSSTRTNLGAILEQQTGNDINRKPSMVRKNTSEKIPPVDQTYSQAYVDGLRAEIKSLQRQLADSEFNHSKLKLHNDQVTERIKVFQEEFSNEISRRKAAETQLARVENENKANHITILDLTRRISEMDADIAQMHEQRKLENGFDSPVSDGRDTPVTHTIPEESELLVGSTLRASISSDTSLKGRFTSVRRSLDMRTNEEGFLTLPSGKRISMDDLSIPESSSVPPSPPISSERDGKSGKRFWKMPFKTSPRPGETLKANISSPKFPPENLKAQISSPKGPSESFARAMDPKAPIPAMFASLDAPLGDSHTLLPHPYLRPVRCDTCKEKMWGLQTRELRCSACGFHCHVKCAPSAPYDCPGPGREYPRLADSLISGRSASPPVEAPGLFGVELSQQLVAEGDSLIPSIVEQCVNAVEARAMSMEGIYRKSGPQTVMKSLRQQLVEGPVDLDMAEFSDITAVTSVLKQYFRELPIPLFTYEYYDAWLQASVTPEAERVEAYAMVLAALPPAYRRTLIFFLDHLHRIFLEQKSNLMSSKNIGVVFGPTLLRCQDDLRDFDDMAKKNAAVDSLIQVWDQVKEKEQADSLKSNSQ